MSGVRGWWWVVSWGGGGGDGLRRSSVGRFVVEVSQKAIVEAAPARGRAAVWNRPASGGLSHMEATEAVRVAQWVCGGCAGVVVGKLVVVVVVEVGIGREVDEESRIWSRGMECNAPQQRTDRRPAEWSGRAGVRRKMPGSVVSRAGATKVMDDGMEWVSYLGLGWMEGWTDAWIHALGVEAAVLPCCSAVLCLGAAQPLSVLHPLHPTTQAPRLGYFSVPNQGLAGGYLPHFVPELVGG